MVPAALFVDILLVWVLGLAGAWGLWRIVSVGPIDGPGRSSRLMGAMELALPPAASPSPFGLAHPYRPSPIPASRRSRIRVVSPSVAREAGLRTRYWTVTIDDRYRASFGSRERALQAASYYERALD